MKKKEVLPLKPWQKIYVIITMMYAFYYFYWRVTETFHPEYPVWSVLFYGAELIGFANLILFTWSTFKLRKRESLDIKSNPTVDVYIPTYNEDIEVLRPTIYHAVRMDYPHETYVLDDGRRPEIEKLALSLGAKYLTRKDNAHAKSGNMNAALPRTKGDIIAVFDADGVPRKDFLTKLIGYFEDPKVALVQVPQTFYNLDSIQHSTAMPNGELWNEQSLFFDICQTGRDWHGASMCCGNGSLTRRSALDKVGGFALGTVTEDLHTTLKLHAQGYETVYHHEPLAYCLAPASLEAFYSQRRRWALGSIQMLRQEAKVIFGPSRLTLAQRVGYLTTIYYFTALQKMAFYVAPFLFAVFGGMSPIVDHVVVVPYLVYCFSTLGLFYIMSRGRARLVLTEIFMLYMSPAYLRGLALGLFPFLRHFDVTSKRQDNRTPWTILLPSIVVGLMCEFGLVKSLIDYMNGSREPGVYVSGAFSAFWLLISVLAIHRHVVKKPISQTAYCFFDRRQMKVLASEGGIELDRPIEGVMTVISEDLVRFRVPTSLKGISDVRFEVSLPEGNLVLDGQISYCERVEKEKGLPIFEVEAKIPRLSDEQRLMLIRYQFQTATPRSIPNLEGPSREDTKSNENRRLAIRRDASIPAYIELSSTKARGQAPIFALCRDISDAGARLTASQAVEIGSIVQVELPWLGESFPAEVKRCVKRETLSQSEFEIGLRIDPNLQFGKRAAVAGNQVQAF